MCRVPRASALAAENHPSNATIRPAHTAGRALQALLLARGVGDVRFCCGALRAGPAFPVGAFLLNAHGWVEPTFGATFHEPAHAVSPGL